MVPSPREVHALIRVARATQMRIVMVIRRIRGYRRTGNPRHLVTGVYLPEAGFADDLAVEVFPL